jgi:hypothetical protein
MPRKGQTVKILPLLIILMFSVLTPGQDGSPELRAQGESRISTILETLNCEPQSRTAGFDYFLVLLNEGKRGNLDTFPLAKIMHEFGIVQARIELSFTSKTRTVRYRYTDYYYSHGKRRTRSVSYKSEERFYTFQVTKIEYLSKYYCYEGPRRRQQLFLSLRRQDVYVPH